MAFRWRVDDDPLIVVFGSFLPYQTNPPPKKKKNKKAESKLDTLWQNFLDPRIAKCILPTASELPIHRNNRLAKAYCCRISDNFIAKNKRSKEELRQELDSYYNNCHFFLTSMTEKQKNQKKHIVIISKQEKN